jgi:hypothetical protein
MVYLVNDIQGRFDVLGRVMRIAHTLHQQVQEPFQLELEVFAQGREGEVRQPKHEREERQAFRLAHLRIQEKPFAGIASVAIGYCYDCFVKRANRQECSGNIRRTCGGTSRS